MLRNHTSQINYNEEMESKLFLITSSTYNQYTKPDTSIDMLEFAAGTEPPPRFNKRTDEELEH